MWLAPQWTFAWECGLWPFEVKNNSTAGNEANKHAKQKREIHSQSAECDITEASVLWKLAWYRLTGMGLSIEIKKGKGHEREIEGRHVKKCGAFNVGHS